MKERSISIVRTSIMMRPVVLGFVSAKYGGKDYNKMNQEFAILKVDKDLNVVGTTPLNFQARTVDDLQWAIYQFEQRKITMATMW